MVRKTLLVACALVMVAGAAEARPHHRHHRHHAHVTTARAPAFPMGPSFGDVLKAMRHPAPLPIISRMRIYIGTNPTGWAHNWCGEFLRRVLGHGSTVARDYARVGAPASGPAPGVIAVWPHHVGVVTAVNKRTMTVISGNDGHRVRERARSLRGVIAWRVP